MSIDIRRVIVKVGSSLVTNNGQGLDHAALANWATQIAELKRLKKDVILVSSGAIAAGMQRLNWKKRPNTVHELQAAAAVGQMGLVQAYESCFREHGLHTAQILLTHDDLSNRKRYLNARSTLVTLLELNVIPIINENDTVVTDEIRFGDNDTLAALVANLVEADLLVILTDQAGLFTADPRIDTSATLVTRIEVNAPELDTMAGGSGSEISRGGMRTKIIAARRAARSGTDTIIAYGKEHDVLPRLIQGESIGTRLVANNIPIAARKNWLAGHLQITGKLVLDRGAVHALQNEGKSLLPIGVQEVSGDFERGELVSCFDSEGKEIGRGLVNYSAADTRRILGCPTQEIESRLGYLDEVELVHRDNFVIT